MSTIIKADNLVKRFGELTAVDDVSFEVRRGELFAFLGINGAGKSTTIGMICGLSKRDGGMVTIDGLDVDKNIDLVKRKIGVVFQNSVLDGAASCRENLKSRAALYGIVGAEFANRYKELDQMFDLKELEKRSVSKLSGGQRRRADIARALVHKPQILILDEPTTGLDPQTRKRLWETIDQLRKTGELTVFLTTHYMEETADADYIVIMNQGKVCAKGTPVDLKNRYTGDYITFYDKTPEELSVFGKVSRAGNGYRIEVPDTKAATELVVKYPRLFTDYEISKGKMDDVFLAATGVKLNGGSI